MHFGRKPEIQPISFHFFLSLFIFFFFFLFPSEGAEGEMVFPTEETPFRSDNTTELFNSGKPLARPHTGAWVLSCKTLWGDAAGGEGSAKGSWVQVQTSVLSLLCAGWCWKPAMLGCPVAPTAC